MLSLDPNAAAALAAGELVLVQLIEMELSEPVNLASSNVDIEWAGRTYRGLGLLGSVDAIDDAPGEVKGVRLTLSGLRPETLALALGEDIRNHAVRMRLAVLDRGTHAVLAAPLVWSGTLDQMPITMNGESATITATAQHRGATFGRPKPLRYTDGDQQRLHPGDTCMRFLVSQANHQDVWPAAAYFKQ